MSLSPRESLTTQFYDFEIRGRGWVVAPFPVDLEPPFHPFFGYYTPKPYIDDGAKETVLSKLAGVFKAKEIVPEIEEYVSPPFELYPFTETAPLKGYTISFAKNAKPSVELMEQCLIMLSSIQDPIGFEIIADYTTVTIQIVYRAQYGVHIHSQLKAYFPEAIVIPFETVNSAIDELLPLYTVDFGMQEECMRPINTGHGETLTGFFGIIEHLHSDERVILQVLFNGTINAWANSLERVVSDGHKGSFFVDAPEMPGLAREKCSSPLFAVTVRAVTQAEDLDTASALLQRVCFAIMHATASSHNALHPLPSGEYDFEKRVLDIDLRQSHRVGMLLNSRELCSLVHFPAPGLTKKLQAHTGATKAAPSHLIGQQFCLGINSHHSIEAQVGIDTAQRLRHLHIMGATGTGKSTLMHSLIMQDVHNMQGLCVIDPHGDLVESVLSHIPEHRIKDVVLIDPTDSEYPVALNILLAHSDLEKELLASDLVALFRRFSTSWGDQMNSVFANAISAFVYNTKVGTLGDLRKFLIETEFRNAILFTCTDPEIVYYWRKEYPILKSSSIGSILTRLDTFLRPRVIRNMVCQKQSLNFQELMDTNKIVLVKLSQGLLGEENSYLLGAFIVSKLQQTAMARQIQEATDRVPFFCYIDEFQHFVTPSMTSILSGARKYSLGLILAHQDMQQVSKVDNDIAGSLLANAGTRICFRLGDTDAKRIQEGFSTFTVGDLQNLTTGEAIVRVNTREQDFNITVLPYSEEVTNTKVRIIEHSRNAYSVPVQQSPIPTEPPPVAEQPTPTPKPTAVPQPIYEPATVAPEPKEIREHRYLQTFIKKMAEEHGYKANIEVPTPDGKGLIDVLLEKDGQHIAVEISVTTPATWELHNIQKCLSAGYAKVIVCTSTAAKAATIQKRIASELPAQEQSKVRVIAKEQIATLFAEAPKETISVIKGYRVKLEYDSAGMDKSDLLQRIVNAGKK